MDSDNSSVFRECGPGWNALIDKLIAKCDAVGARVMQIKEKFGALRFYYDPPESGWDDALEEIVDRAEDESRGICEICGAPGILMRNPRYWVKTVCRDHSIEFNFTEVAT
jgi:hypothetical protein